MSLHEIVEPNCELKDLVLPASLTAQISEILEDHEYQDVLIANGLTVRKKILLHGPPGCGKTSIAHALAKELKMKFCSANSAQIVGSHLGESERNAESVFKFAQLNRVVMLVDEFDSLGSARGDIGETGVGKSENRLVNTILTSMESRPPLGLIVACTNMFHVLDEAIVRRFDSILEVPSATRAALKKIAEGILKGRCGITIESILDEAATPAAVVRVANDKLRRAIINEEKSKRGIDLQTSFAQLELLKTNLEEKSKKNKKIKTEPKEGLSATGN